MHARRPDKVPPERRRTVRLAGQKHDVAHLLIGFPAPRLPRPGKPRPSLFFAHALAHGGGLVFVLACSS